MEWYGSLARPLLFALPPETSHGLAHRVRIQQRPGRRIEEDRLRSIEHVDALHEGQRDLVEVRRTAALRIAGLHATVVHEHEGATRADVTLKRVQFEDGTRWEADKQ